MLIERGFPTGELMDLILGSFVNRFDVTAEDLHLMVGVPMCLILGYILT